MIIQLGTFEISVFVILMSALQFLISLLISERLKASIQWEIKIREQAAKVAEYMALARNLKETSSENDYRKANMLSWELGMWLPTDIYKTLGIAMRNPDETNNPLSIVVDVRKLLLGHKAGLLTKEEIIHHAPGIGNKK